MVELYAVTVGVFTRGLKNLAAVLKKGEEYAKENGISEEQAISETKLHPTMAALAFQIQRASDTSKGAAARLSGVTPPSMPDDEKTFADLQARIQKTLDFLATVDPASVNGKEETEINLKFGPREMKITGLEQALTLGVPNFFFHCVTAYDILRHLGAPVGKQDFLGYGP